MERLSHGTMENYDVMVDDGGMVYYLLLSDGPMTDTEIADDFLDGYDGECSADELDIIRREDVE